VISAVGHETDVTIADFVADIRAATPTAAAEMAVPDLRELRSELLQTEVRMVRGLWSELERRRERLDYLSRSISARRMYSLAAEARQRSDYVAERLVAGQNERLKSLRARLELAKGRLAAVGPMATLCRGYAIARSQRGLILEADDVQPGEVIELLLAEGRVLARVLECEEDEDVTL
jgi:exodeoxyribonuclease VII large subunit